MRERREKNSSSTAGRLGTAFLIWRFFEERNFKTLHTMELHPKSFKLEANRLGAHLLAQQPISRASHYLLIPYHARGECWSLRSIVRNCANAKFLNFSSSSSHYRDHPTASGNQCLKMNRSPRPAIWFLHWNGQGAIRENFLPRFAKHFLILVSFSCAVLTSLIT